MIPAAKPPNLPSPLPGLLVAGGLAALAIGVLSWTPIASLPISPMLAAILGGLLLAPLAARRPDWEPGLDMARGLILKSSVVLLGLSLSLSDLGRLGLLALPLVALALVVGLFLTLALARALGANRPLAALLAAGTAICGASAIAATAPAVSARQPDVAYAIACIALFGLLGTLFYPWVLTYWINDAELLGLLLGAIIHDTAQVTAAASLAEQAGIGEGCLEAATTSKLIRNACLVVAVPLLAWLGRDPGQTAAIGLARFPLFILLFLLMALLRSLGDAWLGPDQARWVALIESVRPLSQFGFAMAMAALAMAIRPCQLTSMGLGPATAALFSTLTVATLTSALVFFLY